MYSRSIKKKRARERIISLSQSVLNLVFSYFWCSHNPWHAQEQRKGLYVVPLTSRFLSLLERSFVAAREAVRRHAVQRCFCACHGTCFLISIPQIERRKKIRTILFEIITNHWKLFKNINSLVAVLIVVSSR